MKKILFAFCLNVLLAFSLLAQTTFTSTTFTKNGYTYETVSNDPLAARIYTLPNGLKVYLSRYTDEPRIQTYIAVGAGSKNDPSNTTGLAHYLEHILFKGTSKIGTSNWEAEKIELNNIEMLYELYRNTIDPLKRESIYHKIDSISMVAAGYAIANEYDKMMSQIGAQGTNAYTFVEQTVYVNDIPSNQIEKWAEIEAERFSMVVPRLFHTELEAVYEEKNKGLDQDRRKVWETTMAALFQKHSYGTQTTIGTIEHLKNPSITEIKKYFNTYYVANNMAVCMSGDLDYDSTIVMIDKFFSSLPNKPLPVFTAPVEPAFTGIIHKNVYGPDAENLSLAYRMDVSLPADPNFRSKLKMVQMLLTNGQAGLIDLNINQAQKAMGAYAYDMPLKDYSVFMIGGKPIAGQTLEELEGLLTGQIELLKQGTFDDWLIPAVVNDYKMSMMMQYESNRARADAFVDAFVWGLQWKDYLNEVNVLESMTKSDIQEFCKRYFSGYYVAVYKRKGVDSTIQKVPKPKISPVPVNRESQSAFYKKVFSAPSPVLKPVFVNYQKEIIFDEIKGTPIWYKKNTENKLFTLQYSWKLSRKYNPEYSLLVTYLDYLGTDTYTPDQLKEEFYKLGCSYSFRISGNEFIITLNGLQENFPKALALLESFIKSAKGDQETLEQIKSNILKTRADNKLSKDVIRTAMTAYAKYEGVNPFTNIIPSDTLKTISSERILKHLATLYQQPHIISYFGPADTKAIKSTVAKLHKIKTMPASYVKPVEGNKTIMDYSTETYQFRKPAANKVYWVNYDMVQAEVVLLSRSTDFNKDMLPALSLYNEYFGGTMGSLVFQEMRESRALAYSVRSTMEIPYMPSDPYYSNSYIGTQADKIQEALSGMVDLIDNMPQSDLLFENSRSSILETMASQRITKIDVLNDYAKALRMGYTDDIRKTIYDQVSTMTYADIQAFQQQYVKGKNRIILIVGSKEKIDFKSLSIYGEVQELTLEEIFGY